VTFRQQEPVIARVLDQPSARLDEALLQAAERETSRKRKSDDVSYPSLMNGSRLVGPRRSRIPW
jgi:hypothetical protein